MHLELAPNIHNEHNKNHELIKFIETQNYCEQMSSIQQNNRIVPNPNDFKQRMERVDCVH